LRFPGASDRRFPRKKECAGADPDHLRTAGFSLSSGGCAGSNHVFEKQLKEPPAGRPVVST
jgi:hypothetical protein